MKRFLPWIAAAVIIFGLIWAGRNYWRGEPTTSSAPAATVAGRAKATTKFTK